MAPRVPPNAHALWPVATIAVQAGNSQKKLELFRPCTVLHVAIAFFERDQKVRKCFDGPPLLVAVRQSRLGMAPPHPFALPLRVVERVVRARQRG